MPGGHVTDSGVRRAAPPVPILLAGLCLLLSLLPLQCAEAQATDRVRPPPGRLYALFVGIDQYPADVGADPLVAPRNDVEQLRKSLEVRFGLESSRTIVLKPEEATRRRILDALNHQILSAAVDPNSTVLFYFSGHGAEIVDNTGTQITGISSSIVPLDARQPGVVRDILDVELVKVIDRANELGVKVVTIFDSCNSGTATRGFSPSHKRAANPRPLIDKPGDDLVLPALPRSTAQATPPLKYRVHLAAAQDHEAATEQAYPDGAWHGNFTYMLANTILKLPPDATYSDLASEVRRQLNNALVLQHPHAEGNLDSFVFGSGEPLPNLYVAEHETGRTYTVVGGTLAGVTPGSQFSVFTSPASAIKDRPLATGRIISAGLSDAVFEISADAAVDKLPSQIRLLETQHNFSADKLRVAVDRKMDAAMAANVRAELVKLAFVEMTDANPQIVVEIRSHVLNLATGSGVPMVECPNDNGAIALRDCLNKVAKRNALLALAQPLTQPKFDLSILRTKGPKVDCKAGEVMTPGPDGDIVVDSGDFICIRIKNRDKRKLYAQVHDLSPDFSIQTVYPTLSQDSKDVLYPSTAVDLQVGLVCFSKLGGSLTKEERQARELEEKDYILLIVSDAYVPAQYFEQSGLPMTRGLTFPSEKDHTPSPLERLIVDAVAGTRSLVIDRVGQWGAKMVPVRVRPGGAECR